MDTRRKQGPVRKAPSKPPPPPPKRIQTQPRGGSTSGGVTRPAPTKAATYNPRAWGQANAGFGTNNWNTLKTPDVRKNTTAETAKTVQLSSQPPSLETAPINGPGVIPPPGDLVPEITALPDPPESKDVLGRLDEPLPGVHSDPHNGHLDPARSRPASPPMSPLSSAPLSDIGDDMEFDEDDIGDNTSGVSSDFESEIDVDADDDPNNTEPIYNHRQVSRDIQGSLRNITDFGQRSARLRRVANVNYWERPLKNPPKIHDPDWNGQDLVEEDEIIGSDDCGSDIQSDDDDMASPRAKTQPLPSTSAVTSCKQKRRLVGTLEVWPRERTRMESGESVPQTIS